MRSVSAVAMNQAVTNVVATAVGHARRADPALPRTGGPASKARLTAWIGLGLLIVFVAGLVTLLDVTELISWHIAIGVLLIPPALVKTATTGWRILRYYTGNGTYRQAGPPPLLLGQLVDAPELVWFTTRAAIFAKQCALPAAGRARHLLRILKLLPRPYPPPLGSEQSPRQRLDPLEKRPHRQVLGQRLLVLIAGHPHLLPVDRVHLGVVPYHRPDRRDSAALGRTDGGIVVHRPSLAGPRTEGNGRGDGAGWWAWTTKTAAPRSRRWWGC